MGATPRTHFLGFIPVDVGALALGYFQANLTCVGILVVLSYLLVIFYQLVSDNFELPNGFEHFNIGFAILLLLLFGMCLVLAITLIVGVEERNPSYVLAYFMSGVVVAAGLALVWMKLMFYEHYCFSDDASLGLFISFFLYLPFLKIVYSLYCNISLENDPSNVSHKTLEEYFTDDIGKDVYYNILHKGASDDVEKDIFYTTLHEGFASDIKMYTPYDELQKDSDDDIKKNMSSGTPHENSSDVIEKGTP